MCILYGCNELKCRWTEISLDFFSYIYYYNYDALIDIVVKIFCICRGHIWMKINGMVGGCIVINVIFAYCWFLSKWTLNCIRIINYGYFRVQI